VQPLRVAAAEPGRQVGAVGGAVDDGLVDRRVVEDRGNIVDDLLDGQRLGRKIGTSIVVP
jgi:hypothetical protein